MSAEFIVKSCIDDVEIYETILDSDRISLKELCHKLEIILEDDLQCHGKSHKFIELSKLITASIIEFELLHVNQSLVSESSLSARHKQLGVFLKLLFRSLNLTLYCCENIEVLNKELNCHYDHLQAVKKLIPRIEKKIGHKIE